MKYFLQLKKIIKKRRNVSFFFLLAFFFFWIFRILPHGELLWQFWSLDGISISRFFEVFWEKTILTIPVSTFTNNIVAIALPITIALNVILFVELYEKQKFILKSKGFLGSATGMFFGIFGVGCAACSGLLLAPLISFLGLTSLFKLLPYGGEELGMVGLILIIISSVYLLKKLSDPLVCEK